MDSFLPPLVTLYRYFIAANKMRVSFDKSLHDPKHLDRHHGWLKQLRDNGMAEHGELVTSIMMHADDYGVFMFYWYSGMYVVIEGYRELGLSDSRIDSLLNSPNVEFLRRCRNGTFHFQKDYFTPKQLEFMEQKDSVSWIREVTEAFSQFFLREIPTC
jgi:hypothetical protein